MRRLAILPAIFLAVSADPALASFTVFASSGPAPADIGTAVNDFRGALGTLNPSVAGSFGTGRREINWDGVPDGLSAPNSLPPNFFNVNSPRGVVLSTPGTALEVSANAGAGPIQFDNLNPTYSSLFNTFSAQRLFTAVDSNIVDVTFFIPGTNIPAFTNGFGSVFTDVDLANVTSLTLFGLDNSVLGTFFAPSILGANETLSFLGILSTDPIGRVRITSGNAPLGPGSSEIGGTDLVVMDDFIFGEPLPAAPAVPEPRTWGMLIAGFAALGLQFRRRRRTQLAGRAC